MIEAELKVDSIRISASYVCALISDVIMTCLVWVVELIGLLFNETNSCLLIPNTVSTTSLVVPLSTLAR